MTINPAILRANYLGKAINVDYSDGKPFPTNQPYQCYDLVSKYSKDNGWGESITGNGYAEGVYRLFRSPMEKYYDHLAYTWNTEFQIGDIVVWKANVPGITGVAGHIAIAIQPGIALRVLEQNNPKPYVTESNRPTGGVAGILRPKALIGDPAMTITDKPASYEFAARASTELMFRSVPMSTEEFTKFHKGKGEIQLTNEFAWSNEATTKRAALKAQAASIEPLKKSLRDFLGI